MRSIRACGRAGVWAGRAYAAAKLCRGEVVEVDRACRHNPSPTAYAVSTSRLLDKRLNMSLRPGHESTEVHSNQAVNAAMIRNEIVALQSSIASGEALVGANGGATLTLDDLNETERSAALIGASPDAYKPIPWMNTHHYTTLLKGNNLDGRLAQQIEAYKAVSQQ